MLEAKHSEDGVFVRRNHSSARKHLQQPPPTVSPTFQSKVYSLSHVLIPRRRSTNNGENVISSQELSLWHYLLKALGSTWNLSSVIVRWLYHFRFDQKCCTEQPVNDRYLHIYLHISLYMSIDMLTYYKDEILYNCGKWLLSVRTAVTFALGAEGETAEQERWAQAKQAMEPRWMSWDPFWSLTVSKPPSSMMCDLQENLAPCVMKRNMHLSQESQQTVENFQQDLEEPWAWMLSTSAS